MLRDGYGIPPCEQTDACENSNPSDTGGNKQFTKNKVWTEDTLFPAIMKQYRNSETHNRTSFEYSFNIRIHIISDYNRYRFHFSVINHSPSRMINRLKLISSQHTCHSTSAQFCVWQQAFVEFTQNYSSLCVSW